jgi:hypothetical protein
VTDPIREGIEVDALRTDQYLEALLAAHDRGATDAPATADLDPGVRAAAQRLARDLVRVHPSFRFEERLAQRLAEAAAAARLPAAAGGETLPFRRPAPLEGSDIEPLHGILPLRRLPGPDEAHVGRPLLIGGAITSAALSIAGAAYIAWRRSRPPLSPMARAVRAARQTRLAARAPLIGPRRRLD